MSPWAREGSIEVKLELSPKAVSGAWGDRLTSVTATLHFRNVSQEPLRIYLVSSEPFRGFQSSLWVYAPGGNNILTRQPELRGHGYVVTEGDFPLLAPGEEKTFTQSLYITRVVSGGPSYEPLSGLEKGGTFRVKWVYSNDVTEWQGGIRTFDGLTKPLFGGGRIPNLWTGNVSAEAAIHVRPAWPE